MEPPFEKFIYRTEECDSWHYRKNLLTHTSFDNQELQFYDYGEVTCSSKGEQPLLIGENNDCYTLHFIVSGKAQYFFRYTEFSGKKNSLIVIPPQEICQVRCIGPEKLSVCKLILMDTPATRLLLARLERERQILIRNAESLLALFRKTGDFLEAPTGNIFQNLSVLIYQIIAEASAQGLDFESRLTVQNIRQELECWPEHNYNLSDLAEKCGLSPRNFEREFKNLTGCSFQRYLIHCRIGNACRLLKSTTYTLSEIAGINNFHSVTYFCRTFKLLTGVPPGKFRGGIGKQIPSQVSSVAAISRNREEAPLSANRKNILWHILHNNRITIKELAAKTSLHHSAIQKNMEYLKKKGFIIRNGSSRNGYWQIIKKFQ